MECIKCRKPLQEDFTYCPYCGKKQVAERKHKKRANGTGCINKLSGNRAKPWMARKNDICIGTFATRAEAQKALERLTDTDINEKYNMTFKQVYQRWHAEHSRNISEKTLRDYEWAFKLCEPIHDKKIRNILRSDYQALIIAQEQQGKSKGTCNKLRVVLNMLGRWAYEEGITPANNVENLTTSAKQLSEREIFLEADIEAIKKSETVESLTTVSYLPIPIRSLFIGDKSHGGLEAPDNNGIQWSFLPNYSDDLAIVAPDDFNPLTDLVPANS